MTETYNTIMIGNPGVGKSTLLNMLLGVAAFKSGGSDDGLGVTSALQVYKNSDGITFIDTPGLADVKRREQAAKEIERALKLEPQARYRIVFVTTLLNGRVLPQDLATIRAVLEALRDVPELFYGVVINQLPPGACEDLKKDASKRHKYEAFFLFDGLPPPTSFFFFPRDEALEGATDAIAPPRADFVEWLNELPCPVVERKQVAPIDVTDWQAKADELATSVKQLCENNTLMEQRIAQLNHELQRMATKKKKWWQSLVVPAIKLVATALL
jgi:energy-coupling factor transporter ATP-binding protein EcfA2